MEFRYEPHASHLLVVASGAFDAQVAATKPPRIAILVTPANAGHSRTFENTAINRGAAVKTTASESDARAFLGIA